MLLLEVLRYDLMISDKYLHLTMFLTDKNRNIFTYIVHIRTLKRCGQYWRPDMYSCQRDY